MSPHAAYALKQLLSSTENLFRTEVLAGLSARPRTLSPRWFYDRRGSELFEAITALPEYYLTRTELAILKAPLAAFLFAMLLLTKQLQKPSMKYFLKY